MAGFSSFGPAGSEAAATCSSRTSPLPVWTSSPRWRLPVNAGKDFDGLCRRLHGQLARGRPRSSLQEQSTRLVTDEDQVGDDDHWLMMCWMVRIANPLVIFRQGAGHVRPNSAADPGLVFDSGINDWLRLHLREAARGARRPCCATPGHDPPTRATSTCASIAIGDLARLADGDAYGQERRCRPTRSYSVSKTGLARHQREPARRGSRSASGRLGSR